MTTKVVILVEYSNEPRGMFVGQRAVRGDGVEVETGQIIAAPFCRDVHVHSGSYLVVREATEEDVAAKS